MTSREGSSGKFRALITRWVTLPSWVWYAFFASWGLTIVKLFLEYSFGKALLMLLAAAIFTIIIWMLVKKLQRQRGITHSTPLVGSSQPMWYATIVVVVTIVFIIDFIVVLLF